MITKILTLTSFALATGTILAQSDYVGPANLVFTMDNTVRLASINTDDAAIVGDEGLLTYSPGVSAYAMPYCDYGTWKAFLGDEDNDGQYGDGIITSIDAVFVPPNTPAPPSFFDVWISIQTSTGTGGYLGAAISDGDVFRLTSTGIETFISQAQIKAAANSSTSSPDVNGFTIDGATGDLYFTFTANFDNNGTTMTDGGILRIPASGYSLTGGLVSAVVSGSAEIVLTEAEVDAMFMNAGYDGVTDTTGIEIDPTGGSFTSAVTNMTMPHLWLCDDDSSDEGFVSTKTLLGTTLAGVIPSVNGIPLIGGAAFGLSGGFSGPNIGNPFGIAFQPTHPTGPMPMHLDSYPVYQTTPATYNIDLSGATPGGFVIYVFDLMNTSVSGAFPSRSPVAPIPYIGPSWREFYPSIPSLGVVLVGADAEGFARFPLTIGVAVTGLGVEFQAADLTSLTISAPLLISM